MELLFVNQTSVRIPRSYLKASFQFFSKQLIKKKIINRSDLKNELVLAFLNKKEASKLNQQFRGKKYATDVLSFSSQDPGSFGELIFCPEVLKKQANDHNLSYRDELVYLALHGFLHLLGYEHEDCEIKAKEMFKLQDELFEMFLA